MNIPATFDSNKSMQILDGFSQSLSEYLDSINLPSQAVLVDMSERATVINILPNILDHACDYKRTEAMYLSKMVAACAVGLFDAAINFLWDETITNLRKKVSLFDLQYFFATAVTDEKQRTHFQDENDLKKLDDWVLIRACCEVGLITEIAHKHLDYIREMRNHASAAHPNQNDISGLQLASYIETCIKEVLSKAPDGALIEIGRLLKNIRTQKFTQESAIPVCAAIQKLPKNRISSVARSVFGMYLDPSSNSDTKNNIQLLLNSIWQVIDDQDKRDLGLKYANFSANGETERAALVRDILQRVNGLSFLDENTKAFELQNILSRLQTAHDGFNNFYTEGPIAMLLYQYIPASGDIPSSIRSSYVNVVTLCYIGNSYGVSWEAESIYDKLVATWADKEIYILFKQLGNTDLSSRLQFSSCSKRFRKLVELLYPKTSNVVLRDLLSYLLNCSDKAFPNMSADSRFVDKLRNIIL